MLTQIMVFIMIHKQMDYVWSQYYIFTTYRVFTFQVFPLQLYSNLNTYSAMACIILPMFFSQQFTTNASRDQSLEIVCHASCLTLKNNEKTTSIALNNQKRKIRTKVQALNPAELFQYQLHTPDNDHRKYTFLVEENL